MYKATYSSYFSLRLQSVVSVLESLEVYAEAKGRRDFQTKSQQKTQTSRISNGTEMRLSIERWGYLGRKDPLWEKVMFLCSSESATRLPPTIKHLGYFVGRLEGSKRILPGPG